MITGCLSRVRTLLAPLCLALAVAATGPAATAADAEEETLIAESLFQHDGWNGAAFQDGDGRFSRCGLVRKFKDDIDLVVMMWGKASWYLSLSSDAWQLGEGERYWVSLKIDARAEHEVKATDIGKSLYIQMGEDDGLYEALRQGRSLAVVAAKKTFRFSLAGSSGALQKLKDCVQQRGVTAQARDNSGRASGQDVSAYPLSPPAESARQSAPRAVPETAPQSASKEGASTSGGFPFDAAVLKSMLVASGVPAPTVFPLEEEKMGDLSFFNQVWSVPDDPSVSGQVMYIPFLPGDPEIFLSTLGHIQLRDCQGADTSTIDSAIVAAGAAVARARFVCDGPEQRTVFYMSGLFTLEKSLIFVSRGSDAGIESARAVDEAMRGRMPGQ